MVVDSKRIEALGPAERLIQTLLTHVDHVYHGRPGIVVPAPGTPTGVRWSYASYKEEGGVRIAYFLHKNGKKTSRVRAGVWEEGGAVRENGQVVGEYRQPGLFPEVAAWMYRQIAEIYKLDNEFVARWASYAFNQEHKDLKVMLAAFLLVQTRRGDPVVEDGKVLFYDEDYRDVGEAMCLIRRNDGRDLHPRLLLRVGDVLRLAEIAAINRDLGFGRSAKNPALGRWEKAVEKYLRYREENPKMLEGMVKAGMRTTVMALAARVGYKPTSPKFYEILRWKQKQAKTGHRTISIGNEVSQAETWEGLSESEVCQRIVDTKPSYKRIVGLLPKGMGLTPAIVVAAVESGCMSNQELIIATPTLEDLGLLSVEPVKSRWERALTLAENQRAANIAARVKNVETKERLAVAADTVVKKAVEEVMKGLTIYFMVDISGSMQNAIEQSKEYITKLLGGFPLEKVKVSVFNTSGREVQIKHPSSKGVEAAFRGITAGGGTDYGAGVRALQAFKPGADEDALFIFVGDEQAGDFSHAVRVSGLNPVAFGLLKVSGSEYDQAVRQTAASLGIPCFNIDTGIFEDVYAIPRTLRNMIAATPVAEGMMATPRVSIVEQILSTPILSKPNWATVA